MIAYAARSAENRHDATGVQVAFTVHYSARAHVIAHRSLRVHCADCCGGSELQTDRRVGGLPLLVLSARAHLLNGVHVR